MLEIKTSIEKINLLTADSTQLKNMLMDYSYVLLIKTDKVELVLPSSDIDLGNVKELRAFDENKELHLVKQGSSFTGRVRIDNQGESCEIYDELQLMWGKSINCENGITELYEDRGIKIQLPVEVCENQRVAVKIRSYISSEKFEFVDFRIAGIENNLGEAEEYGKR